VWRICDFSWLKLTPLMKKKITSESMTYALQHSSNFFQNNFSGSLANKVRDLANGTPRLLEIFLYSFLNVALSLLFAFVALFSIHKFFAFALISWAVLFTFMAVRGAKTAGKMSIEIADQQTKIMGNIVDVFGNISNVKFFSRRHFEQKRVGDFQETYSRLSEKRGWFFVKFFTLHGLTFAAYFSFCIVALIFLYAKNLVTLGDFLMLFTINSWIIHLMWNAATELRHFLEEMGTVNQALQILNVPLEIKDGDEILNVTKGEIIFENVEFGYKNSAPLFAGKNIVIKSGEKVGLVGHSGGGKTTFVNLILRQFDVNSGRILIDGQDISQTTQDSLRAAIGMIPQDPSLFHRTLAENISYGKTPDVMLSLSKHDSSPHPESCFDRLSMTSSEEIVSAARKAHAHNFIENLPQKYDSLVGERGIKLSGGQRQRIAIARAFLKNAPILILDEATSQLDSITENLIQDSLKNLMENKTTLVIAHRLSTLKIMDRILVFDHGKIVEDGSHQELLTRGGAYKKLWDAQVGGNLTNKVSQAEAFLICGEVD
jgi:ATP-binding cassette subfamily B protein